MALIENSVLLQVNPMEIGVNGKFEVPNSVTSIGDGAFWGCTGLTDITIPNTMTSIGNSAFMGCTGLIDITIPNTVTSIGDDAFWGCTGLTFITIPNSVTSISSVAFNGCTGLTDITIPNSVNSIGYGAFWGCTGLTFITIPNSVTSISSVAFNGCTGLRGITIPNSVTSIGDFAFRGCTGLTGLTIPNSVTSIGSYAFSGCAGLTGIAIPNSVISISDDVFSDCDHLEVIVINSHNRANFIRIKELLPANLQSKVISSEEMQEKKAYRDSKLNDALVEERLMPIQAIVLGRKGNDAAFVPGIISQFFGAKTTSAIKLKKQLGAISLTLDMESYKEEVDRKANSVLQKTPNKRSLESIGAFDTSATKIARR